MAKRVRMEFELNQKAVGEFLQSEALGQELEPFADHVSTAATANARASGYVDAKHTVRRFKGKDRQRLHVATGNGAAAAAEIAKRALTRATGGRMT